jgi:hypothetical protein
MAPSKVAPVTEQEILAILGREHVQPLSANELAIEVGTARSMSTPEVAVRHTKPVLDGMVAAGVLHKAEGGDAARAIGRKAAARANVTYFALAERANAQLREIEEVKHRRARLVTLAQMLRDDHPDLFTQGYTWGGELRLTMTLEQAELLRDRLSPALQPQPTPTAP